MDGSRLFLFGQSVSLLGDGLALLAIPLLVLQLTGSPVVSALAVAPRAIGYLIAGLPAGPLVDRADPWRVLIAADTVRMTVFLLLALALAVGRCPVAVILCLACVAGVAGVFFETALAVAVRDVCTGPRLIRANGFLETSGQLAFVAGPAAVGVLVAAAGQEATLLANAGTFAVSLVTVSRTNRWLSAADFTGAATTVVAKRPAPHGTGVSGSVVSEFWSGLRYLITSPVVSGITLLQAVTNLGVGAETLIPFFACERLGASAALVGLVVAGGGIGGALGALIAAATGPRMAPIPMCLTGLLLMAVGLALVGLAPGVLWLAVANALLVGASMVVVVVVRTLRQQVVPRALLGRVTSTARSLVLTATVAGTMLTGLLTRQCGGNPRPVFIGAGVFVVMSTALVRVGVLGPAARQSAQSAHRTRFLARIAVCPQLPGLRHRREQLGDSRYRWSGTQRTAGIIRECGAHGVERGCSDGLSPRSLPGGDRGA
ncbi:MAG: transporter [Nocardia sp.]|uniref:MFS transporter n=1 Tax=Nocardia sp. TaxID=1821 RepID=UPI0026211DD8|nr:MFS transporter [Nocardia sp.]MCU1646219.1 transporter [Nocardia sp.]